jgi:hypothetical protein
MNRGISAAMPPFSPDAAGVRPFAHGHLPLAPLAVVWSFSQAGLQICITVSADGTCNMTGAARSRNLMIYPGRPDSCNI